MGSNPILRAMDSVVYMIKNCINGNIYIGSTISFKYRVRVHICKLRKNTHVNKHLQSAWNKFGELNFQFFIIEYTNNTLKSEQWWIENLKPEYNIANIAGAPMLGKNHSIETKNKISKSKKGIASWSKGKKITIDHKNNISKSCKGKKISDNHKQQNSKAMIGLI